MLHFVKPFKTPLWKLFEACALCHWAFKTQKNKAKMPGVSFLPDTHSII